METDPNLKTGVIQGARSPDTKLAILRRENDLFDEATDDFRCLGARILA